MEEDYIRRKRRARHGEVRICTTHFSQMLLLECEMLVESETCTHKHTSYTHKTFIKGRMMLRCVEAFLSYKEGKKVLVFI